MNAPRRIWLQDGGDYDIAMSSGDDVTWCVSPVNDRDTEYVRADLFTALEAEKAKAEAERDALRVVQNLHSRRKLEARADKAEALLAEAVEALRALRDSLQSVIQHSEGVAGLHRNGDVAPWETLFASGAYEDWFGTSFDDACATLAKIKEAKNG